MAAAVAVASATWAARGVAARRHQNAPGAVHGGTAAGGGPTPAAADLWRYHPGMGDGDSTIRRCQHRGDRPRHVVARSRGSECNRPAHPKTSRP